MRAASLVSLLTLGLVAASATAQTSMDKTLVVVNGQAITGRTYYKRMEVLPGVGQLVGERFVPATPGYLTLSKLINEVLMLQLAQEKGVAPTPAEIEAEFQARTKENPDLLKGLELIGFTAEDLRYDIRVQLAEFKITTMGVNIADQQVEQYYKSNEQDYTVPRRYRLRLIAVDNEERRKAVDAAIAGGRDFGEIAKEFSLHLTRSNGGDMGEVPEGELSDSIRRLVASAAKGSVTEWLSGQGLFIKVKVEDIKPEEKVPLDAALKAEIRRNLMIDRGRVRNNVPQMMEEMRRKAKIEYQGTIFDPMLKQNFSPAGTGG